MMGIAGICGTSPTIPQIAQELFPAAQPSLVVSHPILTSPAALIQKGTAELTGEGSGGKEYSNF